jgi:hypothetical protein
MGKLFTLKLSAQTKLKHLQNNPILRTKPMVITDLNYIEVVNEANVEGGLAFADSSALAEAKGKYFAATSAGTYTNAYSNEWYSSSTSAAYSSSVAA